MNFGSLVVNRDTTIKELLDVKPEEVINALVQLNRNFGKLRNPLLRKLLAKRVSIADACRIADCPVSDFLRTMNAIGFKLQEEIIENRSSADLQFQPPAEENVVTFDVRPILAINGDPLKAILAQIKGLNEHKCLKIVNTFEPIPLINLLRKKGFGAHTDTIATDVVETYFFRLESGVEEAPQSNHQDLYSNFSVILNKYQGRLRTIDVSMLEMPLPLHTILNTLSQLSIDEALFVHHKKSSGIPAATPF